MSKSKKPEAVQLNVAEQYGITALLQKREAAYRDMNASIKQLEESQKSILTTRGHTDMTGWSLDTQTWTLSRPAPKEEPKKPKGK